MKKLIEDSHIFISKKYGRQPTEAKIKLICDKVWHDAKDKGRFTGEYYIDNVRQWSLSAGHNATCKKCLIEYIKWCNRRQYKAVSRLEKEI
jgi:hypothetical protein